MLTGALVLFSKVTRVLSPPSWERIEERCLQSKVSASSVPCGRGSSGFGWSLPWSFPATSFGGLNQKTNTTNASAPPARIEGATVTSRAPGSTAPTPPTASARITRNVNHWLSVGLGTFSAMYSITPMKTSPNANATMPCCKAQAPEDRNGHKYTGQGAVDKSAYLG